MDGIIGITVGLILTEVGKDVYAKAFGWVVVIGSCIYGFTKYWIRG